MKKREKLKITISLNNADMLTDPIYPGQGGIVYHLKDGDTFTSHTTTSSGGTKPTYTDDPKLDVKNTLAVGTAHG